MNDLDAIVMQWRCEKNDFLMSQILAATRKIRFHYARWFPQSDWDDVDAVLCTEIWKACLAFDPDRATFNAYAHRVCHNHAVTAMKKSHDHQSEFDKAALAYSLDREIKNSTTVTAESYGEKFSDIIANPHCEIDAELADVREMAATARKLLIEDASLTKAQKAAVTLVYGQGLAYKEAAEILGTNVKSIDNHLNLALQKLRGYDCRPYLQNGRKRRKRARLLPTRHEA